MAISLPGLLVCLALVALGWRLKAPLVVPMFAALAFGSTAVATLSGLGGSSPLIYVVFAAAFLVATLLRRRLLADIRTVFVADWTAAVVTLLLVYVVASSMLLPRLFAGETTAFVVADSGKVTEVMLAPSNGNITQVAYFALGCLSFFTASIALLRRRGLAAFRAGFFSFAIFDAALGLIDFAGKLSGAGDVLAVIRTASYQMLTGAEQAGFWRIAGGFPEASAFAAASLGCLGFAFGYWRAGRSRGALLLTLVLLALVLLSTSSTAYVACALMAVPVAFGLLARGLAGRLGRKDIVVLGIIAICLVGGVGLAIVHREAIEQVANLFQATLFDKAQSVSGQERSYWNTRSIASLFDTNGLGVGFGSSRASSWAVALLSQTGVIGALLVALLIARILPPIRRQPGDDIAAVALYSGARGAVLAELVACSISGGNADPGLLFFLGLAVCNACRREVAARRPVLRDQRAGRLIPLPVPPG